MYIFELIYSLIKKKKNINPLNDDFEYTKCEHVFMPVDSTKKTFACIKCGVIKKVD